MKKILIITLVFILALSLLAACGGSGNENGSSTTPPTSENSGSKTNLKGSPEDIAIDIVKKADDKIENEMDKFPAGMGGMAEAVTKEDVKSFIGITVEQFNSHVKKAVLVRSLIGTFPDEIFLIECNDEAAAAQMIKWIPDAYDTGKHICVAPGQSFVIRSGQYVLLAATTNVRAEAVLEAFKDMAGNTSDVNVFFEGEGDPSGDIENPGIGGGPAQLD